MNDAGWPPLETCGQRPEWPVLTWLPILLGLLASATVALASCPVPRSRPISASGALLLAIASVVGTVGVGAAAFAACATMVAHRGLQVRVRKVLPIFCGVAAWMTPTLAFYLRDSLWAVPAAFVMAALGSRLIYGYHLSTGAREAGPAIPEQPVPELFSTKRRPALTFSAYLLQLAILSVVAEMAHPATFLMGAAILVISFFQQNARALTQLPSQSTSREEARPATTLALAILLVGASLTPYLAMPSEYANAANMSATLHRSMARTTASSAGSKANLFQRATAFIRTLMGEDLHAGGQDQHQAGPLTDRPYPALQALFGDHKTPPESELGSQRKKALRGRATVLVPEDASPGVILRPQVEDSVAIVPPSPRRWTFDVKPGPSKLDQPSIPFYGAYWFFRTEDRTLPVDAVELRGDPALTSFKTTDFTPMTMEARQNFGSLIELSCCRALELVIANGDRRPGTVALELILTNTRLPGQPSQSLGIVPVNSTLRWFPGDERPPVKEILTFPLPAQLAIQSFDEAIIRFVLQSPREPWSAKIAIERFRLIPREL